MEVRRAPEHSETTWINDGARRALEHKGATCINDGSEEGPRALWHYLDQR